jgi:predicted transcriptional regulator
MSDKPSPPAPVQGLEADAMNVIWDLSEASVRDVERRLNRRADKPRAYTTYMTTLSRLHEKGLLTRRREGKTDLYAPALTRAEYAELRTGAEVAALVETYGDVAFRHFARQMATLDPERRRALQRMARGR